MDGLNYFAINRVLGGVMKHAKRPTFGPFGALHAQHQILVQRPRRGEQISFAPDAVKLIVRAFEETRQGYAIDRLLADPQLATRFFERCRKLGVIAPDHHLALRLLRFRKSSNKTIRVEKPTAAREKRDYSPYLYAAEMASVQINYLYGASVDDIIGYPEIGKEFDKLAAKLSPGFSPLEYRLAALHIRKSQYVEKEERSLYEKLKVKSAEETVEEYGPMNNLDVRKLNKSDGIFGLMERTDSSRFLYINQAKSLSEAVRPFTKSETFDALANSFWSPSLAAIHLVVYDIHESFRNASQFLWTLKLIRENSPVFNQPIHGSAA